MSHSEKGEFGSVRNHLAICVSVLLLALAVFGWGLHSKLSLYHLRASAMPPIAKLLSERERPPAPAQQCHLEHVDLRAIVSSVSIIAMPPADDSLRASQPREDVPHPVSRTVTFKGPSLRRPPPSLFALKSA